MGVKDLYSQLARTVFSKSPVGLVMVDRESRVSYVATVAVHNLSVESAESYIGPAMSGVGQLETVAAIFGTPSALTASGHCFSTSLLSDVEFGWTITQMWGGTE